MSIREEVEILQRLPLFSGVKRDHLNTLAFAMEHVTFAPEEIIVAEGGKPKAAYVVVKGSVEVAFGKKKKPHLVAEIGTKGFIGETAMINNTPYRTTVRAKTEVEALRIEQKLFLRSLSEFPDMAVAIMRALARRLDETVGELSTLQDTIYHETAV